MPCTPSVRLPPVPEATPAVPPFPPLPVVVPPVAAPPEPLLAVPPPPPSQCRPSRCWSCRLSRRRACRLSRRSQCRPSRHSHWRLSRLCRRRHRRSLPEVKSTRSGRTPRGEPRAQYWQSKFVSCSCSHKLRSREPSLDAASRRRMHEAERATTDRLGQRKFIARGSPSARSTPRASSRCLS
jgi:hypothetical protein